MRDGRKKGNYPCLAIPPTRVFLNSHDAQEGAYGGVGVSFESRPPLPSMSTPNQRVSMQCNLQLAECLV